MVENCLLVQSLSLPGNGQVVCGGPRSRRGMRTAAFTLVRSLQSIHAGRLFTQGAHVEGATVGLLPKPALNANGVQVTGDAVAHAVDRRCGL